MENIYNITQHDSAQTTGSTMTIKLNVCVLPVALLTLQYEVVLCVLSLTERTAAQTATRSTATVVTLPITVQPGGGGATLDTPHTPEDNTRTVRGENTHPHTHTGY